MSDDKTTPISEMKYNDLKSLAKERGLDASGTKEELVARLEAADGDTGADNTAPVEPEATDEADAAPETNAAPAEVATPEPAVERAEQQVADRELKTDAQKMKAHLEAQKKVSIMIPFEVGENPEQGKSVKFHVNLNGYALDIPRGVYVEVPEQIADIIKERLESEGKIGSQWRLDRDPAKQEALG